MFVIAEYARFAAGHRTDADAHILPDMDGSKRLDLEAERPPQRRDWHSFL
jgi:hypothetical protein